MAVTRIELKRRKPYAEGREFGAAGSYERIDAIVHYAVDPVHERNNMITDLDLAPRDDNGLVRFYGDLCVLVPTDPNRANRRLFLELPNRGRRLTPRSLHRAQPGPAEASDIPSGDGFLFRHGFAVGSIGWQWDVYRSDTVMGIEAPEAENVEGRTMVRFQPNSRTRTKLLTDRAHKPLPAADVTEAAAQLTVREWELSEPTTIPRDHWQFAREENGDVIPDSHFIYYERGFEAGKVYELTYTTNYAPIGGAGLLAIRDAASFLRYSGSDENPCAGLIDWVYGFGISQTGRLLRRFVHLGMNLDEHDRQVFDGLIPHVAGARQGDYNCRFGQAGNSVQATPNFGHYFPFADEPMPDPVTGRVDGMLKRQREIGGIPKIFWTNTSAEYWRGDGFLLHIDPAGSYDLEPASETRIYSFAGTQHSSGSAELTNVDPNNGAQGRYNFNTVDYSPLLRAAIINLDRWVTDGVEPPPSYHPRIDDGTAITYQEAFEKFPKLPGLYLPGFDHLRVLPRVDLGPDADKGVHAIPPKLGEPYRSLVWKLDQDGNEDASVRLPDLSTPVGTHTGWNPRHPDTGAPEQLIQMRGSTFHFPQNAEERLRSGDPRRSIDERYPSRDEYLAQVRKAAERMVQSHHLLEEDIDLVVADAAERYDASMYESQVQSPADD